jgi:hypothetical protein
MPPRPPAISRFKPSFLGFRRWRLVGGLRRKTGAAGFLLIFSRRVIRIRITVGTLAVRSLCGAGLTGNHAQDAGLDLPAAI